jgi:hypothetical protein
MRWYRPTTGAEQVGTRRLGDSGRAALSGMAVAVLVAVAKRVFGRR